MKIGFITHYTGLYGANRSLLNLIDGLNRYTVSSYVISPQEGEITDILRSRGVPVEVFPIQWWVSTKPQLNDSWLRDACQHVKSKYWALKRLYLNFCLLKSLVAKLRMWEIDVVYTNSTVTPIGLLAAKLLQVPHVWHWREFGDLDYSFFPDWGKSIQNQIMYFSDVSIAVSEAIRKHFLQDAERKGVYVIYNGVASEAEFDRLYTLNQQSPCHQKPYTFALVGVIDPCKGQAIAIQALSLIVEKFPETRLLIVGLGNTAHLQQLANNLRLERNIEIWGHIQDPYAAYLVADAVLMCSKNEAMGRVTVEAMSACRPVIGYDNAGTSELIEHEYTGILYTGGYKE